MAVIEKVERNLSQFMCLEVIAVFVGGRCKSCSIRTSKVGLVDFFFFHSTNTIQVLLEMQVFKYLEKGMQLQNSYMKQKRNLEKKNGTISFE